MVLEITIYLGPDDGHNQCIFHKTLLKKGLEFVPSKRDSTIMFNFGLVPPSPEIDPIAEGSNRKRYAIRTRGIGCIKMILALPIEVITFYVGTLVIQVRVSGLKSFIPRGEICLTMLLAFDKQF